KLDRIITFLGIAGFIFAGLLSQQVFPSAAIDLSVPRQAIHQRAEVYLTDQLAGYDNDSLSSDTEISDAMTSNAATSGNTASSTKVSDEGDRTLNYSNIDLSEYESVQRFGQSSRVSIYLQRTLGIAETNRLIKEENLPIHYWSIRHFKPSQEEEFSTYLSTTGELLGYRHRLPEAAPGENLEQAAAQEIAQTYLTTERGWNLNNWSLVDASTTERPARTDHSFNWKRNDFDAGEAELRLSVGVRGNQVGFYDYWVKTPEAFSRAFSEERSTAGFIARICNLAIFYGPLSISFIFFIVAIAQNKLDWRAGLPPALLFFAVSLLSQLNNLPLDKAGYSTTQNYTLFWVQEIYTSLFYAVSTAVPIYFLWLGGQQLAKRVWPQRDMVVPRSPARLKQFTQAYWRGIMLGGISLGYVVVFYLMATRIFGSWSPMDVNYSNLFSTPFPFLSPLRSGILPGISEELESRLVGIGIILLLTRQRWLALLIPGGLWAFAHLGYVSDPIYLRGIELLIAAIFLHGLFFLRFGLLTTIVGHCVYNAMLGANSLLRADDAYLIACGIVVVVLLLAPLVPGLWQQWQQDPKDRISEYPLTIQAATQQDYPAIRNLYVQNKTLQAALEEDALEKAVSEEGQAASSYELMVLKDIIKKDAKSLDNQNSDNQNSDNYVKGLAIATIETDGTACVEWVYVKPQYRRCYYGTQLLQALTQRLQQRNIYDIRANVTLKDKFARRFWLNQNWQTVSQVLHYERSRRAF
ncbi:MAG: GNAT family N-acetyltransferase, partial [Cyanobacteria bacterium J06649_4]